MPRKVSSKSAKAAAPRKKAGAKRATAKTSKPPRESSAKSVKPQSPAARSSTGKPKAGAKPKLLSGGNPQIPKGDGDAPVAAYIAAMPGWKGDVGRALDALIMDAVPEARKAVRWNTPFYGVEDQGWFIAFHCITKYVKVTFFHGASLRPVPPVESKVKEVRYFHIHEGEFIDEKLLKSWIKQAAELPGMDCF